MVCLANYEIVPFILSIPLRVEGFLYVEYDFKLRGVRMVCMGELLYSSFCDPLLPMAYLYRYCNLIHEEFSVSVSPLEWREPPLEYCVLIVLFLSISIL